MGIGWVWEGYTGTHPATVPGPIFNLFLRLRPTYGQMKAILRNMMRFLRKGPERVLERVQNDLRMTLPDTLPDRSPDGPPDPHIQTSDISMVQNRRYLPFY